MPPDVATTADGRADKIRLTGIEVGRALAATAVVLFHALHNAHVNDVDPGQMELFAFGHAGVDLFFVISGFVITHAHHSDLGRPDRLHQYINRRFQRVYPLYWLALAVALLVDALRAGHSLPSVAAISESTLLLPTNSQTVLDVAWTLQFEVLFYAVVALTIVSRRAGIVAGAMWLFCVLIHAATGALEFLPVQLRSSYGLEFLFGVIAATWLRLAPGQIPRGTLLLGALGYALTALAEDGGWLDGYADAARLSYGLASMLLVVGSVRGNALLGRSVPRWLRAIGAASYSIYLFQFFFITAAWQVERRLSLDEIIPGWASVLLLAAAALLGGMVTSRVIEYPLLGLTRRWGNTFRRIADSALGSSKGTTV